MENILKEAIPDEDYGPSEVYTKLMELPWRDVFTTNYDTLLERAADKVSKRRYNVAFLLMRMLFPKSVCCFFPFTGICFTFAA